MAEAGVLAPASTNGATTTAWLARAYTLSAPSMVSSHTSGELQLTSEIITVFWSTKSAPNTSSAMRTASAARSGAVTGPMNGLSECLIAL